MKIRPLNDWAVIVPAEADERTAGGLYIPDAAKEKPAEGVVESIGPGALEEVSWKEKKEKDRKKERKFIPTTVKPGERVMYEPYAGTKITLEGQERVLVREKSILGIFTGAPSSDPRPLMLPERTTAGETSLATLAMSVITAHVPAQPLRGKPAAGTGSKKAATKKALTPRGRGKAKAAKKKGPGAASKGKGPAKKKAAKKSNKKR